MALTNSRPLSIPTVENDLLHNSSSPIFQFNNINMSLDSNNNIINSAKPASFPGSETVDIVDINPLPKNLKLNNQNNNNPSLNSSSSNLTTPKKENPLLEISKLIPVTGERPMPEEKHSSIDDNVLYAVFVILWEMDPNQNGMTVKQLCDHLLVKHPEMSNLSTKLSNLISAKLNAYVKKIEKGEKTLTYAISREWSNSSPRRMLYIYRGILSPDYKKHAQLVTSQLKKQLESNKNFESLNLSSNNNTSSINNTNNNDILNKNSSSNLAFTLSPEFNIPYSSSPVSVNLNSNNNSNNNNNPNNTNNNQTLTPTSNVSTNANNTPNASNDLMKQKTNKKRSSNDDKKSALVPSSASSVNLNKRMKNSNDVSRNSSSSTLNSASVHSSNNLNQNSVPNHITAISATPRISKLLPKNGFKTNLNNNNNNNVMISSLHKIILTQSPILKQEESSKEIDSSWTKIVREGFLTKEIESPELLSLDELDNIFN